MNFIALLEKLKNVMADLRYDPWTGLAICLPIAFAILGPKDWVYAILYSPMLPPFVNFALGFIGLCVVSCVLVWLLQQICWLIRKPFLKKPKGDFSGWDDSAPGRS
jgi:hypothetical protein